MNSFNVRRKLLFLCVTSLFITACQTGSDEIIENSTTMDGVDQSQLEPFDGSTNGVDSSLTALEDGSDGSAIALGDEAESPQAMLDKADSALSNRVIYFQFDNSSVSEDSLKSLKLMAALLPTIVTFQSDSKVIAMNAAVANIISHWVIDEHSLFVKYYCFKVLRLTS